VMSQNDTQTKTPRITTSACANPRIMIVRDICKCAQRRASPTAAGEAGRAQNDTQIQPSRRTETAGGG
jgi:hypothetical protein